MGQNQKRHVQSTPIRVDGSVRLGQSPEIVAEMSGVLILEAWFRDYDHFNTMGFEHVTQIGQGREEGILKNRANDSGSG